MQQCKWRVGCLGNSFSEKDLVILEDKKLNISQESQQHRGLCQTDRSQQVRRGGPPLFSTCETAPGVVCPVCIEEG